MVRKVMGPGARAGHTSYNYDSEEDVSGSDGGAANGAEDLSSAPELPSDDDSDYHAGGGSSKKKKKKASPKKKKASKKGQTPRGKISPAKTPASKRKAKYNYVSDDYEEEEEEEAPPPPKSNRGRPKKGAKRSIDFDEYEDDDDRMPPAKKKKKGKAAAPAPYKPHKKAGPGRSSGRSPAKKPVRYNYSDDDSDVQNGAESDDVFQEEEEEEDYYEEPVAKKSHKKKAAPPAKKGGRGRPAKKGSAKKGRGRPSFKRQESEEEEVEESEVEEVEESDDEGVYRPKKKNYLKAKQQHKRKPPPPPEPKFKLPKVSEMVTDSILALKENPKKGSTLGAIKETILLNWSVNMSVYDAKIKKFITNAEKTGEIIRTKTKGTGFRGRFTVPGMKVAKKKRKKSALGKKFDEDEVEYQPKQTQRAEDKEKTAAEIEQLRQERLAREEKKLEERANRPVKPRPVVDPNKEWEVEAIKGIREKKDGKVEYLVKWFGSTKQTWEPEENVEGCQDLINAYMIIKEKKDAERESYRKLAEEEGAYEVAKIMNMKVKKTKGEVKREFLVRWKGFGAEDDTWEPEDNLDCFDLIAKCEQEFEAINATGGKARLREAPKAISRLEYTSSKRINKRGGFRISYAGMDD